MPFLRPATLAVATVLAGHLAAKPAQASQFATFMNSNTCDVTVSVLKGSIGYIRVNLSKDFKTQKGTFNLAPKDSMANAKESVVVPKGKTIYVEFCGSPNSDPHTSSTEPFHFKGQYLIQTSPVDKGRAVRIYANMENPSVSNDITLSYASTVKTEIEKDHNVVWIQNGEIGPGGHSTSKGALTFNY